MRASGRVEKALWCPRSDSQSMGPRLLRRIPSPFSPCPPRHTFTKSLFYSKGYCSEPSSDLGSSIARERSSVPCGDAALAARFFRFPHLAPCLIPVATLFFNNTSFLPSPNIPSASPHIVSSSCILHYCIAVLSSGIDHHRSLHLSTLRSRVIQSTESELRRLYQYNCQPSGLIDVLPAHRKALSLPESIKSLLLTLIHWESRPVYASHNFSVFSNCTSAHGG